MDYWEFQLSERKGSGSGDHHAGLNSEQRGRAGWSKDIMEESSQSA